MLVLGIFIGELILLFLLSRLLTRNLSRFLYRVVKSEKLTIYFMAFLFLPGTIIHELAHFLTAIFTGVHAEGIEFWPKLQDGVVKLGSVGIGRCDPFRRALIGVAPFIVGLSIMLGILFYTSANNFFDSTIVIFLVGYVIFEIGNTMFSSRKDMEGVLELLATILITGIICYFIGLRISLDQINTLLTPYVVEKIYTANIFVLIPIILDSAMILVLKLTHKL